MRRSGRSSCYELAKMDGAIIVDEAVKRLAWANVQLMPDPTIPSNETGTRHRTAERVAKQTGALVVSVSQQRETVTIFVGPASYQLDPVADVLAKTNQALGTLETYRQRLEQVLTRLTALEFQNAVVLDDVLVVLQRAEMISRMAKRITRDCVELGTEGRLIRLQLEEFVGEVPGERDAIVRDYHVLGAGDEATAALADLSALTYQELLEFARLAEVLGYDRGVNPLDQTVVPRGYRILSHLPRLPEPLVRRVVVGSRQPRRGRSRLAARARVGGGSRGGARPRDPRRAPPPAGAQPRRSVPAALVETP